jgi:hypothetical protein
MQEELLFKLKTFSNAYHATLARIFQQFFQGTARNSTLNWFAKLVQNGKQTWRGSIHENNIRGRSFGVGSSFVTVTRVVTFVATRFIYSGILTDDVIGYDALDINTLFTLDDLCGLSSETKCGPSTLETLPEVSTVNREQRKLNTQLLVLGAALFEFFTLPVIKGEFNSHSYPIEVQKIRNILIFDREVLSIMANFFEIICALFLTTFHQNRQVIAAYPEFLLSSLVHFFNFAAVHHINIIDDDGWVVVIQTMAKLISARDVITNYHLRCEMADLIYNYYSNAKKGKALEHSDVASVLLNGLLGLSLELHQRKVNFLDTTNKKIKYITTCIWNVLPHRKVPAHVLMVRHNIMKQLLPHWISDQLIYSEECFKIIKNLKTSINADEFSDAEILRFKSVLSSHEGEFVLLTNIGFHNASLFEPYYISFAQLINYNLNELINIDCSDCVINPETLEFNRKRLLSILITIMTRPTGFHLDHEKWFSVFVSEEADFNKKSMEKLLTVVQEAGLKNHNHSMYETMNIFRFASIAFKIYDFISEEKRIFQELNPDFVDGITGCLMRNPVILPASGVMVDITTIKRHLAKKQTDPFTNTPLSETELKPFHTPHLDVFWTKARLSIRNIIYQARNNE